MYHLRVGYACLPTRPWPHSARLTKRSLCARPRTVSRQRATATIASMAEPFKPTWPAGLYASARPDYPRSVLDAVLDAPACAEPMHYVDLAAGTGIFTRLAIEACTNEPGNRHRLASVTAIEPSTSMLRQLSLTLFEPSSGLVPMLKEQGKLDRELQVHTAEARFDTIDLTDIGLQGKIDLLTVAQAWHWCENWNDALTAIAKVLRPGGVLALVWNLEDRESARWVGRIRDAYEKYEGNSRQYRHNTWREMYDTKAIKQFDILPEQHLKRSLPTTVDGVCDRIASKSYISMQPAETQKQIMDHVRQIFAAESDENLQRKWIDKAAGTFEYPYATDVFLFQKK